MKSNNNIAGLVIVLVLSFLLGYNFQYKPAGEIQIQRDTIYKTRIDSFRVDSIIPKEIVKTFFIRDTLHTTDSIPVEVQIPIETASFDTTIINNSDTMRVGGSYEGYRASITSLWATTKVREKETIVTQSVKQKRPLVSYGVIGGFGWGITQKKPDAFIGFGLVLNL